MEDNYRNSQTPAQPQPQRTKSKPIDLNLNIQNNAEVDEGITFVEIFEIFKSGLPKILIITIAALVIGLLSAAVYHFVTSDHTGEVSGIIAYNFDGAEIGLDPKGYSLSVEKIKSASVISRALDELGLSARGVTVEDVRQNITISGVVPDNVMEQILVIGEIATKDPSKLEQLPSLSYTSTEYVVTFNIPKKISAFTKGKSVEFLGALLRSYEQYFFEEYGDRNVLSSIVFNNVSEYDYAEISEVFSTQIDNMIAYITEKQAASPNFRSVATKMSFGDIAANLRLIKNIDIGRFEANVESLLLTRDPELLITSYNYRVIRYSMEMEVQLENAKIAQEALAAYQRGTTAIVGSENSTTYFEQSSETYDNLTKQAEEALRIANKLQKDIDYYSEKIVELQTSDLIPNRPEDLVAAEDSIKRIVAKLDDWVGIVNETMDEYIENEALKDSTRILLTPQYKSAFMTGVKTIALITAVFTLVGFAGGIGYIFIKRLGKQDDGIFEI